MEAPDLVFLEPYVLMAAVAEKECEDRFYSPDYFSNSVEQRNESIKIGNRPSR